MRFTSKCRVVEIVLFDVVNAVLLQMNRNHMQVALLCKYKN
jgi:hypothetical protein